MHISDVLTIVPAIMTLIVAIFTEVYKYTKYRHPKTSLSILNRVYKPLHQLLQHCIHQNNEVFDSSVIYNKYFTRISSIVQTSYELVPPALYNSYYKLIEIDEHWNDNFKQFCKLVDIGYNQYRKLLHYPHKSVTSEYHISCADDKLLLQQVFFTRLQFYINNIIIIYIAFDNMIYGPFRRSISDIKFMILALFILLLTLYICAKYIKMYKDNPFGSYPLF